MFSATRWATRRSCAHSLRRCQSSLSPLPHPSDWRQHFQVGQVGVRDRVSLSNPDTAARLAEALVPAGGKKGKIVVEAFPGPGALTRALLELPKDRISKLIVMEEWQPYLAYLKPLEEFDPRVTVIPKSGYTWDTYQTMKEQGLLDGVIDTPWDSSEEPNLHFVSHIPQNIMGEQLVAQFFRCIPDRSWLFQHGRVPMSLVLGEWLWQRVCATNEDKSSRCKVSVIAEATATHDYALKPSSLIPYDNHFHPVVPRQNERRPETRRIGQPLVAVNIYPRKEPYIEQKMLDKWDYVLRRLFVKKATPLEKALPFLAPGADALAETISGSVDVTKQVRELDAAEWQAVLKAFDEWPFAPDDLMISDAFQRDSGDRK